MPAKSAQPAQQRPTRWEWRQPPGHENQPRLEWWLEQVAVVIVLRIGRRAHRRGDTRTLHRMVALSNAGKIAETTERTSVR